jgi:hypothetical protein
MGVYLSYAEADEKLAGELAEALRAKGVSISDPARDLPVGENWALQIGLALERADAMIVLLTPNSLEAKHVNQEIDFALTNRHFKNRLFPVLAGVETVPWAHPGTDAVDLDAGIEPTAAAIAAQLIPNYAVA